MNKPVLPLAAALVSVSLLVLGSCRKKETQDTGTSTGQPNGKTHVRNGNTNRSAVSDFQKKRIRTTVDTIKSVGFDEQPKAVQVYEQLLQAYPSDVPFLHELALEAARTGSDDSKRALAAAVVRSYRSGNHPKLGEVMDALRTEGVSARYLVELLTDNLRDQKDLVVRAYGELIANPSKVTLPEDYQDIASGAAREMGYPWALAQIPDIYDKWFGTAAANELITNWAYSDPVAASTYVRDLPQSAYRDTLISHLVQEVADSEDFEMAYAWAEYIRAEDIRNKAIAIAKRQQQILENRNKQRAEREAAQNGAPR